MDEKIMKSKIKYDNDFVASIDFGGYNTEDDFWEQV